MSLFVDDVTAEQMLNHETNVVHKLCHDNQRPKGALEIPLEQKAMIGLFSRLEGPSVAAEVFDVSPSSASNFAKGETVHGKGNPELKAALNDKVKDIHSITAEKLLATLDVMDVELIAQEKPRVQAGIAKDLATVMEKTSEKGDGGTKVQVIVYAPQPVDSMKFETIEVEAKSS